MRCVVALAFSIVALSQGAALASSPSLGSVTPRGGQRGTEMDMFLGGGRLSDAKEVMFYSPGFEVTAVEVVNDGQVKAHVKIAPDCRIGEHALRLRTASGISELRTFFVGPLPSVDEVEPNNDFAAPQKIGMNVTIAGVAENEDVDYFVVDATKGQRLSVEVEGMRLGTTVFDPYVAILDAKRFEIAASDDLPLVWQDGVASAIVPEDGQYVVEVRETSYAGNGACVYRAHVGTFPRPTAVLPAGGKLGEEVEVRFLGDVAGEIVQKTLLPAAPLSPFGLVPQDAGGIAPSPNSFRLSPFGNVIEAEPNNAHDQATAVAELPIALNGVLTEKGDVDMFRFKAKQGETYEVHCYARRIRSPLDPVLTIDAFGGGAVVGNDDAVGPDSYVRFTAPAEQEFVVRVTDHLGKGGPDYAYRIEFTPVKPELTLSIPKVALYSQERQIVVVPRGNRYAALIAVNRVNFGGDLAIEGANLPAGVTVSSENMPANLSAIPVLFEAAADAPTAGTLTDLTASHVDPAQNIKGGFDQVAELTTGGPGQSIYWTHKVDRLAVAVADEVPFKISIVEPKVPLVQNGSMNLKIVAERKEGYTAPIEVQMLFNPPGVGSASSATIPEGQNECLYPVNANGGAEVRKWKIAVIGQATVGDGPMWVSSQLASLEIAPPFVAFAMERAACEQGQSTDLFCKLTQTTPFEGPAKVQVIGLPNKVTAPEMEITKETLELVFKVSTDATSPAGRHQNIFCQLVVMHNGEPVVHNVGGTEIQIDVPLPPKADEPMPMAVAQAELQPEQPMEKRLTRLEKLRLEAAERNKQPQPQAAPQATP